MTSTRTECDGAGLVEHAGARTTLGLWCALFVLFATSVAATVYYCATMSGGMDMPGGWSMSMMWMPMAGQTWAGAAVMFMLMWLAMMVAMMLPSALPMIFGYHAMQSRDGGKMVAARTLWMTGGYFFVWSGAGAVIFVAGIF
jgi:predicted metal-binding membrane protein